MKKKISVLLVLVLALSLALIGCSGDTDGQSATGADATAESEGSDGVETNKDEPFGDFKGYLDEETGFFHEPIHRTDIEISYSLPDGYTVLDGLSGGAGFSTVWLESDYSYDTMLPITIYYSAHVEDAQELYDTMNDNGRLGESHEVKFGPNTYISNVTPTKDGLTYYFCKTSSAPVFYFDAVSVNDDGPLTDPAALEEVLSTFTY